MKKILLIEDTKSIHEEIGTILRFENYDVIEATTGTEGLEKAITEKPDLIISDIMMPGMDGFELKQELLNNPVTKAIPFIIFSARVEKDTIDNAMELGVLDYLKKPVDPEILLVKVQDYLGSNS
jgi:CheY-like chemotaxis protein